MTDQLRVRQTRSVIGHTQQVRRVLRGLGLRRIGQEVVVPNTPSFRGMVKKVLHLVAVEEMSGAEKKKGTKG